VGNRVAHVLAANFGSMDALAKASEEELAEVNEIGPVIADSVHDFFCNKAGQETVKQLQAAGVDPRMEVKKADVSQLPLAGKSVVVTGTMKHFDRKEIEERIVQLGGKASGSVSKKTDRVVFGENAGSKLDKAKELGVAVQSEDEFIAEFKLIP
jgi:DNA ligase (NAD+)